MIMLCEQLFLGLCAMTELTIETGFLVDHPHLEEIFKGIAFKAEAIVVPATKGEMLEACFYCDGGARPHPPMAGWGIHGYFFIGAEPKQGTGCPDTITASGYMKNTGTKVTPVGYIDGCGAISGGTNNAAETEAVIIGLLAMLAAGVKAGSFFCDSRYVLSGCTDRMEKMRMTDFMDVQTRQPIPNADLWRIVSLLLQECEKRSIALSWNWVKGHSDNLGNNKADVLATRGITLGRNGNFEEHILIAGGKGYWNPSADYDRFLNEGRWFFQMSPSAPKQDDGRITYYLGNTAMEDPDHGVPDASVNYAVVKLKDHDPVLEAVEARTRQLADNNMMHQLVVGRLDTLFNPSVYTTVMSSGVNWLYRKDARRLDLWSSDKIAVTQEIKPVRKSYLLATTFNFIEETLLEAEAVINGKNEEHVVLTEITNSIYEAQLSSKKAVVKVAPSIDNGDGFIHVVIRNPIDGQDIKIPLSIGIDTPKRNMLAAIAAEDVKVWVVAWKESAMAFRYATLVRAGDRIGLWAAIHSNLRLIA